MRDYVVPLQDIRFLFDEVADLAGSHLRDGKVFVHESLHDVYRRTTEGG